MSRIRSWESWVTFVASVVIVVVIGASQQASRATVTTTVGGEGNIYCQNWQNRPWCMMILFNDQCQERVMWCDMEGAVENNESCGHVAVPNTNPVNYLTACVGDPCKPETKIKSCQAPILARPRPVSN